MNWLLRRLELNISNQSRGRSSKLSWPGENAVEVGGALRWRGRASSLKLFELVRLWQRSIRGTGLRGSGLARGVLGRREGRGERCVKKGAKVERGRVIQPEVPRSCADVMNTR